MARPMNERNQAIENMANEIFDILNPEPLKEIKVGKATCLELVERCLRYVEKKFGEEMVSR